MDDAMAATPAAFYLRHYVDEHSPLFDGGGNGQGEAADGGMGGLATDHVIRIFCTAVGLDQVSLIDVAGHKSWNPGRDIVRGGRFRDMSMAIGSNRFDLSKLNSYDVDDNAEVALRPVHKPDVRVGTDAAV